MVQKIENHLNTKKEMIKKTKNKKPQKTDEDKKTRAPIFPIHLQG